MISKRISVIFVLVMGIVKFTTEENLKKESDDVNTASPISNMYIPSTVTTRLCILQYNYQCCQFKKQKHSNAFRKISVKCNPVDKFLDEVTDTTEKIRSKRNVFNLFTMMFMGTNCNPFDYQNYGCYCGLYGRGIAVDGIDRCCQQHDNCYGHTNCWTASLYTRSYKWDIYGDQVFCLNNKDKCARGLCECDLEFIRCIRQYPCPDTKATCKYSYWW